MTVLFSILLYPIFFILAYAAGEYIFDSRNMTMAFAILCAFTASYFYYAIRERSEFRKRRKLSKNEARQTLISRTMLLDKKTFRSLFPGALCNNSTGISEDQLLDYLRKFGCDKKTDIYSLNGMSKGCRDLLALLKIEYTEHTVDEILSVTKNIDLPEVTVEVNRPRRERIRALLISPNFRKFALKYGLIIALMSILTPYKLYYILFGGILTVYAVLSSVILKLKHNLNRQNQIQDLGS